MAIADPITIISDSTDWHLWQIRALQIANLDKVLLDLRYCFLVFLLPFEDFTNQKRSASVFSRIKYQFCQKTHRKTLLPSLVTLILSVLMGFPVTASAATKSRHVSPRTTIVLANQTEWIKRQGQSFTVSFLLSSPLAKQNLGLQFVLYSKLTSRYAYAASAENQESGQSAITTSNIIPINRLRTVDLSKNQFRPSISFPISLASPQPETKKVPILYLNCNQSACDGVYPLQANLIDIATGKQLGTLTTHIIYTAFERSNLPLEVGLIIPIGENNYIKPNGTTDVPSQSISSLRSVLSLLTAYKKDAVTLNISPQLLYALDLSKNKNAEAILPEIRHLINIKFKLKNLQILGQTFSNINATQLVKAHLASQIKTQFQYGQSIDTNYLKISTRASPYLSSANISPKALNVLTVNHINRMVLPEKNIALNYNSTITAPLRISENSIPLPNKHSTQSPEVLLADQGLANRFNDDTGDPQLEASTILGELAQIYFDAPDALSNRCIVISPSSWGGKYLMKPLLAGLLSSNILQSKTINQIFATVRTGTNGSPTEAKLDNYGTGSQKLHLKEITALTKGYNYLRILESILGTKEPLAQSQNLLASASILEGETNNLSSAMEKAYFLTPYNMIKKIEPALSLNGNKAITLTSSTGKVPVTVSSDYPIPLNVELSVNSSEVIVQTKPKLLSLRHLQPVYFQVTTRTSGRFILKVQVFSPTGHLLLLNENYVVSSTAISLESLLLTALALFILIAWWIKSFLKSRKNKLLPSERH
ncbi:MAG: DUF6049 family protein [Firmicutes bacterium]|nr:DUF6049 family protein [Bacillota bacterium]